MSEYPEHEKLKKVSAESQVVGAFLDWLMNDQGVVLGRYHVHDETCDCADDWHKEEGPDSDRCPACNSPRLSTRYDVCGKLEGYPNPIFDNIQDWLALYFEIDRDAIEQEKRAMLETLRKTA